MNLYDSVYQRDVIYYQQFLDGDMNGFEELVREYKNILIFFLQRYVKDIDLAEDLAQDAFVDVFIHKDRYNRKQSFKTYLFTIGRNKAVDYIRKNKHFQGINTLEDYYEVSDDEQELIAYVIKRETKEQIVRALTKLKEEYAKVIILVDIEGFSYKEAAHILNKTNPQVKVLLHRARKKLKEVIEKEGFTYEDR